MQAATAEQLASGQQSAKGRKIEKARAKPIRYPFWIGGSASSMAACVTHPLDLVKVRLQVRNGDAPSTTSGTFAHIVKTSGLRGLYAGLSASLLRQLTYSTTRFGVYEELKQRHVAASKSGPDGKPTPKPPNFAILTCLALASGFLGGISGNAADIINVRMQYDAALPPSQRRNYVHALDGMVRMAREEGGLRSWFRGWFPNAVRASVMSAGQMASYDVFKRLMIRCTPLKDTLATHFLASSLAGVMAATVTSPVDVVKTRVMSASGKSQSVAKVLGELYAAEGLRWMFKGWVPSFLRLGPQTVCTFLFLETHRKVYRNVKGLNEPA